MSVTPPAMFIIVSLLPFKSGNPILTYEPPEGGRFIEMPACGSWNLLFGC